MNRSEKQQAIDNLNQVFKENPGVFLFGFRGINVPDVTELRRRVRDSGNSYHVVKNRLAIRAARGTAVEKIGEHFSGPTAVAYSADDPVALAKTIKTFLKDHTGVEFKAGVLNEAALSAGQVEELADMPSRDELLVKFLGLLKGPLTQLAGALQAPLRNLGSALKQLEEVKAE